MTRSRYDPTRLTLGAECVKASKYATPVVIGDLSHEMMKGFVEDLNNTIASKPFDVNPFYILIHEKKDALLKNALLRRILVMEKRPYPENDTVVFWHNPATNETKFCWALPHHSVMDNILHNEKNYAKQYIEDIKAFKRTDIQHFGLKLIKENSEYKIVPIPNFKDRPIEKSFFKAQSIA